MAWKRLTELGAMTVKLFDVMGQLIPPSEFATRGFTLSVSGDGTVQFDFSDVSQAQNVYLICIPDPSIAGKKARVTVTDALVEGAVTAGGEPADMSPSFGAADASTFFPFIGILPTVVLEGANENAVGITPNPWTFTDGPPPGSEHVFEADEAMGMLIIPSVGT